MAVATYGKVRYIDNYCDAPESAVYIVRMLHDGSILLQQYSKNNSVDLARFPFDAYWKENFHATLCKCRKLIGCNKVIWVEKPDWWVERDHSKKSK